MQTSWVQHKTIVAVRSLEQVKNLFRRDGKRIIAEGKMPLLLHDPTKVYFVESGAIDLFLVDLVRGVPRGRRTHFVRVERDELMMAMPPLASSDKNSSFATVAVGGTDTTLLVVDRAQLIDRANSGGALDALHGAVDAWVRRLSGGLSDQVPPAERVEALPTGRVVYEPGTVITASPKTVWFRQFDGTSRLVGVSPVRPKRGAMLPLTRESWLHIDSRVTMSLVDSETYFRWDPQWTSIARFHHFVLDCLARRAIAAHADETAQLEARDASSRRTIERALVGLARVDARSGDDIAVDEPPVLGACRKIADRLGVRVQHPGQVLGGVRAQDVAQVSRLRLRTVLLPRAWMRVVREPLLGFLGSRDRPVALLPRPLGGFDLFDPVEKTTVRATEATTAQLNPSAYVFYRPLPAKALSLWDLAKFSAHGIRGDLIVLLLTGLILGGMAMAVPWATGKIVDDLIPSADGTALDQLGGLLVVLAVSTGLIQIVRGAAALRMEMRSSSSLQAAVWDRLLALPVPFFRRFSAADLALRANSIETLREAMSGGTLTAILMSMSAMLNFAVMLAYSVELAMIAALLALVSVLISGGVGISTVLVRRRLAEVEGRLSSLVLQLINGISKLRVAGAERRAFALWARQFVEKRTLTYRARRIESRMAVVSAIWPTLMTVTIFYFVAADHDVSTRMGTGSFLAFNAAFGIFVGGLVELTRTGVDLLGLVPILERARPLFLATPEIDERRSHPGALRGAIQVSHVSFRYAPEGPLVLDDVDFEIKPGEFVALVGASAAGKSTLLRVLLGFEQPESGGVFFDRQELSSLDVVEVRRQMGVVLQSGQPVAGDILENIFASRRLTIDDAWAAARMAGLDEDIERMPMKMHTVLGQGAPSLSGGQRQRLMIARAVVTRPRILFFDEATSALDNATQAKVTQSLERLQATRVVVAHRLSTIRNADKIVVMDRGRIVQVGTYEELVDVEGVFRDIAERQMT